MKLAAVALLFALTPNTLRTTAHNFYEWLDREYPVSSSDAGKHTWDDRLTDYSAATRAKRAAHVREVLATVRAADVSHWSKDDVIDWLLFRSYLERDLLAAEEGLRPAAQPRARRHEAPAGGAASDRAGEGERAASRPALRAVRHRLRARHRSALQRQPHDAGEGPHARGARRARQSERRRAEIAARLRRRSRKTSRIDAGVEADGGSRLQLHAAAHPSPPDERRRRRAPRRDRARPLPRARGAAPRPVARRSESATRRAHPARPAIVPRAVPEPRGGDDRLPEVAQPHHAAAVPRAVPHPPASRRVQADQSRRLHESARPLRQGRQRLLLHPDVQPVEQELLHPRRDRGPPSDPRTRRHPRPLSADLHRQSSAG